MHFITWLLTRAKTTMFGKKYKWVQEYRQLILRERFLSIFLTLFLGLLFLIGSVVLTMLMVKGYYVGSRDEKVQLIETLSFWYVWIPPVFYVYHWIMALHEVYTKEQEEMWERLKEND